MDRGPHWGRAPRPQASWLGLYQLQEGQYISAPPEVPSCQVMAQASQDTRFTAWSPPWETRGSLESPPNLPSPTRSLLFFCPETLSPARRDCLPKGNWHNSPQNSVHPLLSISVAASEEPREDDHVQLGGWNMMVGNCFVQCENGVLVYVENRVYFFRDIL